MGENIAIGNTTVAPYQNTNTPSLAGGAIAVGTGAIAGQAPAYFFNKQVSLSDKDEFVKNFVDNTVKREADNAAKTGLKFKVTSNFLEKTKKEGAAGYEIAKAVSKRTKNQIRGVWGLIGAFVVGMGYFMYKGGFSSLPTKKSN